MAEVLTTKNKPGQSIAKRSKKYVELNERITALCNRYQQGNITVLDMITLGLVTICITAVKVSKAKLYLHIA